MSRSLPHLPIIASQITFGLKKLTSFGNCSSSFSRSPQYWSSYTSFLRDIVQTCYALETWRDASEFKKLYRAMVFAQQDILSALVNESMHQVRRETAQNDVRQTWMERAEAVLDRMDDREKVRTMRF